MRQASRSEICAGFYHHAVEGSPNHIGQAFSGKVNDYRYVLDNFGKVKDHISYGIRPWDNLIMTFSNEAGGHDGKPTDAMIECWLLKAVGDPFPA